MKSIAPALAAGSVLALALAVTAPLAAPRTSCHIHPPQTDEADEAPTTTLGPFSRPADCEAARARLFGDLGRCHCNSGFARAPGPGRMLGGEGGVPAGHGAGPLGPLP